MSYRPTYKNKEPINEGIMLIFVPCTSGVTFCHTFSHFCALPLGELGHKPWQGVSSPNAYKSGWC